METETYPGGERPRPTLAHRLAALATHAETAAEDPQLPVGPVVAASLTGLRAEVRGMRADLDALRARVEARPSTTVDAVAADGVGSDAVEARLAAIEDTLDGLAERMEALTRDSATDTGERLAALDDRLAAVAGSLQAERSAAGQHRERNSAAIQEQSAALDEWSETVRTGLDDLAETIRGHLGSLSESVSAASSGDRDGDRRHVEALVAELSQTVEEAFRNVHDQVDAYCRPLDGRLADLHDAVLDGFGAARTRLVEELSGTLGRLEDANAGTRAMLDEELAQLRSDLADALDEVRERIETTVGGANESIAATLDEHQAASEDLRETVASAARAAREGGTRIDALEEVVSRVDATLADLQGDWRPQVDAVMAQGRAAAQGVLEEVRTEISTTMAELRAALREQSSTVANASGMLGGGSERLIAAGQALLAYLGERDRWLERERDRVLHEVLDEFAQGLSAKERRAVSARVAEALDRRRDARDAERYRRTQAGQPAVEVPPVPPEIAALGEPVEPKPPPRRAAKAPAKSATKSATRSATRSATKSAKSAKSAAKPTASTTRSAAKKSTKSAAKTAATPRAKKATSSRSTSSRARTTAAQSSASSDS